MHATTVTPEAYAINYGYTCENYSSQDMAIVRVRAEGTPQMRPRVHLLNQCRYKHYEETHTPGNFLSITMVTPRKKILGR